MKIFKVLAVFIYEKSNGRNPEPTAKAPGKIKSTALIGFSIRIDQSGPEADWQVARVTYWSGLSNR